MTDLNPWGAWSCIWKNTYKYMHTCIHIHMYNSQDMELSEIIICLNFIGLKPHVVDGALICVWPRAQGHYLGPWTWGEILLYHLAPLLWTSVHRCYSHENSFAVSLIAERVVNPMFFWVSVLIFLQLCDFHLTFSEHYLQNRRDIIIQITKLFEWNEIFANVFLSC